MSDRSALRQAIDLLHRPNRVRLLQSEPLPEGVDVVLRIAAGDADLTRSEARRLERSPDLLGQAAGFYIEQILLAPDADSYRIFGAPPSAPAAHLRQNMALLLRWLHPDVDRSGTRSVFAARVTKAWEDIKTPERRAAYDRQLAARRSERPANGSETGTRARSRMRGPRTTTAPTLIAAAGSPRSPARLLRRGLMFLFRSRQP